jgi:hypothetical protein
MKTGNKVRMTAENSNWVIGETGTITQILPDGKKVVVELEGREDDYTVFVGDFEIVESNTINPLKKPYRLYLNGDYFHGGYDSIAEARAEISGIVAGFDRNDIEKLGGMEWSVQNVEENESIIVTASTPEEIEDMLNEQVERELPWPGNGFESDEEAVEYQTQREDRFVELCQKFR